MVSNLQVMRLILSPRAALSPEVVRVPTENARPYGIRIAPDGTPWIVLFGTNRLASVDPKTLAVEETCENCGGAMTGRRGKRGFFLGCSSYPKCKGTKEPSEATLEKISGRRLTFTVSASDHRGLVAAGRVTRVVVDIERFMEKAN